MNDITPGDDKKIPNPEPVNYQQPQNPYVAPQYTGLSPEQNLNPDADVVSVSSGSVWKRNSGLVSMAQLVIGAVVLAAIINSFVFQSYQVFGMSMSDTLHEGDRLIISKVSKSISNITGEYVPARGDIIVFKSPISPDIQLIKRVIALPGERVTVKAGKITVYNDEFPSGFNPDDSYSDLLPDEKTGDIETVVSDDEIFVSGDNRVTGASLDSRNELGNVPIENIVGELVLRVFPLDQASFF